MTQEIIHALLLWTGIPLVLIFLFIAYMVYVIKTDGEVTMCPHCQGKVMYRADVEQLCTNGHWFDLNGILFDPKLQQQQTPVPLLWLAVVIFTCGALAFVLHQVGLPYAGEGGL